MNISRLLIIKHSSLLSIAPRNVLRYYNNSLNNVSLLEQKEEFMRYHNQERHKWEKEMNDLAKRLEKKEKDNSFLGFIIFILSCMLTFSSTHSHCRH